MRKYRVWLVSFFVLLLWTGMELAGGCQAADNEEGSIGFETEELVFSYGQMVTYDMLPACYFQDTDGTKTYLDDYQCQVDWDKGSLYLSWGVYEREYTISLVESRLCEILAEPAGMEVKQKSTFTKEDFYVIGVYNDGTKRILEEYELEPCRRQDGTVTEVLIGCQGVWGSCRLAKEEVPPQIVTESACTTAPSLTATTEPPKTEKTDTVLSVEEKQTETPVATQAVLDVSGDVNSAPVSTQDKKNVTEQPQIIVATVAPQIQVTAEKQTDITPPVCNIRKKVYSPGICIRVSDGESGVKQILLLGKKKQQIANGTKLNKEGDYRLQMTDRAGNVSQVSFSIQKPVKSLKVDFALLGNWKQVAFISKTVGTSRKPVWSVSDRKVGTITPSGKFRAKKSGTCYVSARLDQKKTKRKVVVDMKQKFVLVY